jgi:hypothetical protein
MCKTVATASPTCVIFADLVGVFNASLIVGARDTETLRRHLANREAHARKY